MISRHPANRDSGMIITYQESPVDVYSDTFEPCNVQHGVDVVCFIIEDNVAAVAASFERLADGWSIICSGCPTTLDDALLLMVGCSNSREEAQPRS